MKQNLDFTEIKQFCDKVGLNCQIIDEGVIITKPKDIWEGVEFCTDGIKVYKIDNRTENWVHYHYLGKIDRANYSFLEPSTEQAYIEQLKKEAFERFGEEWNIEMFDYSGLNSEVADFIMRVGCELFMYLKSSDTLFWRGIPIYKQGKWATRVKERVKVDHVGVDYSTWSGNVFFGFSFKGSQDIDKSGIGKFLSSQLEKYLNGEIE